MATRYMSDKTVGKSLYVADFDGDKVSSTIINHGLNVVYYTLSNVPMVASLVRAVYVLKGKGFLKFSI